MSPIDKVLNNLTRLGKGYKQVKPNQYKASSPLREDKRYSLSITVKPDGSVLLHDFGGGDAKDIVAVMGLEMKDLFPPSTLTKPKGENNINLDKPDVIYSYRNAQGVEVGQVLRYGYLNPNGMPDKTFKQRHVGSDGRWIWKAPPNIPLYRLPELLTAHPDLYVFIPEGEKDVDRLAQLALIGTTNMGGAARKWPDEYIRCLSGRKVCLLPDNDKQGLERVRDLAERLLPVVNELKVLSPTDLGIEHINKADVSDALDLGTITGVSLQLLAENAPPYAPPPPRPTRKIWFARDELLNTNFPEPRWLVKGLLPEQTLAILAGRPKIGKSWLVLQLCNAVADGSKFFERETSQAKTLYICLEDNARRIKNRLVAQNALAAGGLFFALAWPDLLAQDGLDKIYQIITQDGFELVVIDTFARAVKMNPDDIKGITEVMERLQQIAFETGAAIILIDHHRKSFGGVEDVVDAVVDATAKTATVDLIMGLYRPQREKTGLFKATGRDIEDVDLTLKFNSAIGTWEFIGESEEVGQNETEEKIIDAIITLGDEASGQNIVKYVNLAQGYVYQLLRQMALNGKIEKSGNGRPYTLPTNTKTTQMLF